MVVEEKAAEAKMVGARVPVGVRAPSQELYRAVVLVVVLVEEAVAQVEDSQASEVKTTTIMMTLTNAGRREMGVDHRGSQWLIKSHASKAQLTPQLTETCQFSISLIGRRELSWAIAYWIGLQRRREQYTR